MPAAGADSMIGADSQCALTIRMLRGLGMLWAQAASSRIHGPSSNSGGAPWLRYSAGSGPSSGTQDRCARLAWTAPSTKASNAAPGTAGWMIEVTAFLRSGSEPG